MKRVRRILVPVDFSRPSLDALRAAVRIALRVKAQVHLLHVLPVPHGPGEAFRALRELKEEGAGGGGRLRRPGKGGAESVREHQTLAALAARYEKGCGRIPTWLAMGRPGEEIVLAADQLRADLVVMGTRGLTGLTGALLGSSAAETVRSAGVPVLTIGAGSRAPFDPRRVLVADDLGVGGLAAIGAAASLFDPGTSRLLLLHVIDPGRFVYTGISEWGWAPTPVTPPGNGRHAIADLEKRAARLRKKGFRVECAVADGSPAETIAAIADKWQARTLVLATHQRTALARLVIGSTAEALVRRSSCPILTVKPVLRAARVEKRRAAAAAPVQARSASGHKIEASAAHH